MNFLVVTSASALALVVVHSVTFFIGRRIGRYNVVDVAWGVGFVVIAAVAAALGHGDPTRRWLLLALVAIWGVRLSWHIQRKTAGKGEDPPLRRPAARCKARPGAAQGLPAAGVLGLVHLVATATVGNNRANAEAVAGRDGAGCGGVAGRRHLRSGRRSATAGVQIRPGQSRRHHGPRPVVLDPPPQLLRRRVRLVGVVADQHQQPGGTGHGGLAIGDDLFPGARQRRPAD